VVDSPVDAAVSLILQPSQVIELQMQLDEYKEKYKAIARSTNIKAQLKRAQMLEYNMSQMEDSQRRVRALLHDCSGLMLILHPFQLVHQNTQFKRDLEERVGDYEELKSREDEMVHQIQLLQTQLAQAARQPLLPNAINAGRIAKPMRGELNLVLMQNSCQPLTVAFSCRRRRYRQHTKRAGCPKRYRIEHEATTCR
jgi:hypothetical protein